MKCFEAPVSAAPASPPNPARTASDVMQAVLFSEVLKPLTAALGPVGDMAVGSVVQSIFTRTRP